MVITSHYYDKHQQVELIQNTAPTSLRTTQLQVYITQSLNPTKTPHQHSKPKTEFQTIKIGATARKGSVYLYLQN